MFARWPEEFIQERTTSLLFDWPMAIFSATGSARMSEYPIPRHPRAMIAGRLHQFFVYFQRRKFVFRPFGIRIRNHIRFDLKQFQIFRFFFRCFLGFLFNLFFSLFASTVLIDFLFFHGLVGHRQHHTCAEYQRVNHSLLLLFNVVAGRLSNRHTKVNAGRF